MNKNAIFFIIHVADSLTQMQLNDGFNKQCETFQLKPVSICILLEMEDTIERVPMMMAQLEVDAFLQDWNYKFHMECMYIKIIFLESQKTVFSII